MIQESGSWPGGGNRLRILWRGSVWLICAVVCNWRDEPGGSSPVMQAGRAAGFPSRRRKPTQVDTLGELGCTTGRPLRAARGRHVAGRPVGCKWQQAAGVVATCSRLVAQPDQAASGDISHGLPLATEDITSKSQSPTRSPRDTCSGRRAGALASLPLASDARRCREMQVDARRYREMQEDAR